MANQNPTVTFTMENGDVMVAELYPEIAPNTVNNFISLVKKGFYDGLIFHRVIAGFMIQGGDPEGTGMGGPGYSIKGEFSHNGFENNLKHTKGVLSMARSMHPDSAGSQFFIMHENAPHLDGEYAAFGKLTQGNLKHTKGVLSMARSMHPDSAGSQFFIMHENAPHLDGEYAAFGKLTQGLDVLDKIAVIGTDWNDRPVVPQVLKTVTVDTFGVDYDEPETV